MAKHDWDGEGYSAVGFDTTRYGGPAGTAGKPVQNPSGSGAMLQQYRPYYVDATDAMANKGFYVSFQHAPSLHDVSFKAFITAFNESYNCDWASEQVYGRADPIYMFKQNTRDITLALNIPAATVGEAFDNLNKVQRLVTFLYPTYDDYLGGTMSNAAQQADTTNALTITNSPLIRLKVMNLLAARPQIGDGLGADRATEAGSIGGIGTFESHGDGSQAQWNPSNAGSNRIAGNYHGGLLGVIKNLAVNHNLDNPDFGVFETSFGTILPKMIDINITFAAIHEHTLGWIPEKNADGEYIKEIHGSTAGIEHVPQAFSNQLFPYGTREQGESQVALGAKLIEQMNDRVYDRLENKIDELNDKEKLTEQQRLQAEARYAGMFGKARARGDARRRDNAQIKANIAKNKSNNPERSDRQRERLARRSERRQDRADYLQGTRNAAADLYGDDWIE